MKYKLQRENYYLGNKIKNSKDLKRIIIAYMLCWTLLGESLSTFILPKFKNLIKDIVVNPSYGYIGKIESYYNDFSDKEKNDYVVKLFCNSIDANNYLSEEEKNFLKVNISRFLSDYGYLYYRENLAVFSSWLMKTKIEIDESLLETVNRFGQYESFLNIITVDDKDYLLSLCHEITHAISSLDIQSNLIKEGITSSIDRHYYNQYTYSELFRNQVFFLAVIVGRDNLIEEYINTGSNKLKEIIGDDYDELMELFNLEWSLFMKDSFDFIKTKEGRESATEIANFLKKIYENKTGEKIQNSKQLFIIYNACLLDDNYRILSDMFDEDLFVYSYDNKMYHINLNEEEVNSQYWIPQINGNYTFDDNNLEDYNIIRKKKLNIKI